jgi:hypothetical protein
MVQPGEKDKAEYADILKVYQFCTGKIAFCKKGALSVHFGYMVLLQQRQGADSHKWECSGCNGFAAAVEVI